MSAVEPTVTYREIPGFPGYRAGDDGSVWSALRQVSRGNLRGTRTVIGSEWRQLKARIRSGYHVVDLCRHRRRETQFVHRLVLLAFVGPAPEGAECCHADGNPLNNRLENLRWDTRKGNAGDRERHGRTHRGERIPGAKLTADLVRKIRADYAAGGTSYSRLADKYGVTKDIVHRVVQRRTWKHVD